jgi:hypothetical protein
LLSPQPLQLASAFGLRKKVDKTLNAARFANVHSSPFRAKPQIITRSCSFPQERVFLKPLRLFIAA